MSIYYKTALINAAYKALRRRSASTNNTSNVTPFTSTSVNAPVKTLLPPLELRSSSESPSVQPTTMANAEHDAAPQLDGVLMNLEAALGHHIDYRTQLLSLGEALKRWQTFVNDPDQDPKEPGKFGKVELSTNLARAFKPILEQVKRIEDDIDLMKANTSMGKAVELVRLHITQGKAESDQRLGHFQGKDQDTAAGAEKDTAMIDAARQSAEQAAVPKSDNANYLPPPCPQSGAEVPPTSDALPHVNTATMMAQVNQEYTFMIQGPIKNIDTLHGKLTRLLIDPPKVVAHELKLVRFGDEYQAWMRAVAGPWAAMGGTLQGGAGLG